MNNTLFKNFTTIIQFTITIVNVATWAKKGSLEPGLTGEEGLRVGGVGKVKGRPLQAKVVRERPTRELGQTAPTPSCGQGQKPRAAAPTAQMVLGQPRARAPALNSPNSKTPQRSKPQLPREPAQPLALASLCRAKVTNFN